MPAAATPISSYLRAEFSVLSLAPPGAPRIPFGILILNRNSGAFDCKLRDDLDELPLTPEDREYVSYLDADFRARVQEIGGPEFMDWLEDTLSGFLLVSDREAVSGRAIPQLLNRLFDQHVDSRVIAYQTHLPYYPLRAAATKFGEEGDVADSDVQWVRIPDGLRGSDQLFVVQVVGRSMEPLIPDGSRVIFRKIAPGSRQGKRLLIEERGASDSLSAFTVKRYTSSKTGAESGEWTHQVIRLEPLNPEFPAFELDPEAFEGRYRVVGEFVQVLDSGE